MGLPAKRGQLYVSRPCCSKLEIRVRRLMVWAMPQRFSRVTPKGKARRKTGLPGRRIQAILAPADTGELRAHAPRKRVAAGLFQIVQHVFVVDLAVRILDRRIHPREDTQVVQFALGIGESRWAKEDRRDSDPDCGTPGWDACGAARPDRTTPGARTAGCLRESRSANRSSAASPPAWKLHSKVALGKPFSKYCARMVSRSTATLNSLNGWPPMELSCAISLAFVQVLDALHLQVADEVLRPLVDRDRDGHVARLSLVVVANGVETPSRRGSRSIGTDSRSPLRRGSAGCGCNGRAETGGRWPAAGTSARGWFRRRSNGCRRSRRAPVCAPGRVRWRSRWSLPRRGAFPAARSTSASKYPCD